MGPGHWPANAATANPADEPQAPSIAADRPDFSAETTDWKSVSPANKRGASA
jgi:hypothetical protein